MIQSPIFFLRTARWLSLVCCVVLLLVLLSCSKSDDPTRTLYVVSPHASDTRLEFTKAFAAWHKEKYGYEVTLKWPDYGGTSDIVRFLANEYATRNTCGCDIFFGGGSGQFDDLNSRRCGDGTIGYLQPPPEGSLAKILPGFPADTKFVTLHDPKNRWFAATMSNFGIAINKVRIEELGLKTPATWEDLADPAWFGQVSVADPSKSGSVKTCYENILQQYGWEKGWLILAQIFANADAVKDGGSNPAEETDLGNTAAGIVIDFFARNHVAKLGPDVMGFVIPEGSSTLDSDPIAILRGAPNAELAGHLVEFVTSEEGQKLWTWKTGTGAGGPVYKPLGRLSIRREMYTDPERKKNLFDATDPFAVQADMTMDRELATQRGRFLGDLMKSCFVDNHELMVGARRAVNELRKRDAGRAAELDRRMGELPKLGGEVLTRQRFSELLALWLPTNKGDTERNQTGLKEGWRADFAGLYRGIAAEAGR